MKNPWLILLLGVLQPLSISAVRSAPPPLPVSSSHWNALIKKHGYRDGQVGLVVLDVNGKVRASVHARTPLIPASNQKILVVTAALERLGVDFAYETRLWSDRAPVGTMLQGDLVVSGNGDPNVSGRFTGGDTTAIFRDWARRFRKKGVSRINGDVLIDDFAFDAKRFLSSWMDDQWSRWYSAQIGALTFNDNCVDVTVTPTRAGALVRHRISPTTAYVRVENTCKSSAKKVNGIILERLRGTNRIVLKGKTSSAYEGLVTVDDPGLYFGTVLKEVFEREGLRISGKVIRDRDRLPSLSDQVLYHRHTSPLALDLPVILRDSHNLHAELLLKALAHADGEMGSVEGGGRIIRAVLREYGIDTGGLRIADGSGFSRDNRVSPMTLATILHRVKREKYFPLFHDSMAVSGKAGTLSSRLRHPSLRGRVFAKTGYLKGIWTLSGYLYAEEREVVENPAATSLARPVTRAEPSWVFSILVNGYSSKKSSAHSMREEMLLDILKQLKSSTRSR